MTKRLNNILLKSALEVDLKETHLSIQIYLGGFSFCVYHPKSQKHIAFQYYEFKEKQKTPENLLKEFKSIFDANQLLNQSYKKLIVIHQNELFTTVPNNYLDKNNLKQYLQHTVKVLPIDYVSYDSLKPIDANIVYIPFVNINNFLFHKFGGFDFYHSATLLTKILQEKQKDTSVPKVYINVYQNSFELLVFEKQELLFLNSFDFRTAQDFIYYILFVLEQLQLDPNSVTIELLGAIEKESELYEISRKYLRNLTIYDEKNPCLTSDFDSIPKHAHFSLLNYAQHNK